MLKRTIAALATLVVTGLALSGCATPAPERATVRVAVGQAFSSFNAHTSYGDSAMNRGIIAATNSQFTYYDDTPALRKDESFGTYQVVSRDPLRVTYTIREGVKWSDGAAVDGADLLLAWAARSGALNTPGFDARPFADPATGRYTKPFPRGSCTSTAPTPPVWRS